MWPMIRPITVLCAILFVPIECMSAMLAVAFELAPWNIGSRNMRSRVSIHMGIPRTLYIVLQENAKASIVSGSSCSAT